VLRISAATLARRAGVIADNDDLGVGFGPGIPQHDAFPRIALDTSCGLLAERELQVLALKRGTIARPAAGDLEPFSKPFGNRRATQVFRNLPASRAVPGERPGRGFCSTTLGQLTVRVFFEPTVRR